MQMSLRKDTLETIGILDSFGKCGVGQYLEKRGLKALKVLAPTW